jgi:NAD(P)-dependent dehydrogenase (short-subunit alcohol dehydrogenase family)
MKGREVMRLKDKVAIITGASKGLGAEMAKMFAREGATVVGVARSIDRLEKLKEQIESEGGRALVFKVDVRNREELKKMADETYKNFGKIDILVNNAGYLVYGYPIDDPREKAEEIFRTIMDTNFRGYWYSIRYVVPYMKKNNAGSIINISSVRGHNGLPNQSPYCAAKGAINMLTRSLAVELAPSKIRVNNISPGAIQVDNEHWVNTLYGKEAHETYFKRFSKVHNLSMKLNQPLYTIGRPSDVGYAAIYLASNESPFVTGTDLIVDGGLTTVLAEPAGLNMEGLHDLYEQSKEMREWFSTLEQ